MKYENAVTDAISYVDILRNLIVKDYDEDTYIYRQTGLAREALAEVLSVMAGNFPAKKGAGVMEPWKIRNYEELINDNWAPFIEDDHVTMTIRPEERTLGFGGRMSRDITGTTFEEWHGVVPTVTLGTGDFASSYLAFAKNDTVLALLERIAAGYSSVWVDGHFEGRMSDDAIDAHWALQDYADEWSAEPTVYYWQADDWLQNERGLVSATATDAEVSALAERIISDARNERVHLSERDLVTYLTSLREQAKMYAEDEEEE